MVDLEGISGICSRDQIFGDRISEGKLLMTEDINACVNAAKEAGVERIYVRDCHGTSNTVIYEKLSDNADYYICGYMGESRYTGIEDCDAVILLGYHAMAGVMGATLEHTFSSKNIQNYGLDGKKVGGLIITIDKETKHNHLDILFVSPEAHSKGIGYGAWQAVEALYPETEIWETCTPYFEKRNIHFYVNKCGFQIDEFWCEYYKTEHNMPDDKENDLDEGPDEMFHFVKKMKR